MLGNTSLWSDWDQLRCGMTLWNQRDLYVSICHCKKIRTSLDPNRLSIPFDDSYVWKDVYLDHPDLKSLARSQSVFRQIELDPDLDVKLPRPGVTPGRVLEHCVQTFESLYTRNKPMTWKFGFTHNAAVRWGNTTFGYKYGKERYDYMLVLYATPHAHGAAFLEAALIDRFRSYLIAMLLTIFYHVKFVGTCAVHLPMLFWSWVLAWLAPRYARLQKWEKWWWYSQRDWRWTVLDVHSVQIMESPRSACQKCGKVKASVWWAFFAPFWFLKVGSHLV